MPTKVFTSGRIRKAEYDTASRQLDLHWDNKSILAYKHVPDDFDATGLSLRHLHSQGHALHVAVLATGASGVEDGFAGATDVVPGSAGSTMPASATRMRIQSRVSFAAPR